MKIIDIEDLSILEADNNLTLCLGYFDGIHKGHLGMFKKALSESSHVGLMTFDISPKHFLNHTLNWPSLLSLSDKADYLEKLGFDSFYVLRATDELFQMTRDEFIDEILKRINPKKIIVGEDYSFGRMGAGTPEYLQEFFDTEIFKNINKNGKKISTHDIIVSIEKGDIELANDLLGRNYSLYGLVVDGNHIGRTIGFPTANLKLDFNYVMPKVGVYAGYAIYMDARYKAIISISTHPSIFELKSPIVEVNFIDFEGNLYGKEVTVEFVKYIRDIITFDNLDSLKEQLTKDKAIAKKSLH